MNTDGNIITIFFKITMKFNEILVLHEFPNFYLVQDLFKGISNLCYIFSVGFTAWYSPTALKHFSGKFVVRKA